MLRRVEDRTFLALLIVATLAFAWVVSTFFDAIIWAVIAAILFAPMQKWLVTKRPGRPNSMALITLLTLIAIVIVPLIILGTLLLDQAAVLYVGVQSGKIDFARYLETILGALPDWGREVLDRFGFNNVESVRGWLGKELSSSFEAIAGQVLNIGQRTLGFVLSLGVMLYLTFFLLRDGPRLAALVIDAIPLESSHRRGLADKFAAVVRATIKGHMVVAIIQGILGGVIFAALGIGGALIWGVSMAFFSMLPAIGTGLVWIPVSIYLFATGAWIKGVILVLCGVFVIGLVDNALRPVLIGRDTRMPDYVILISTLGGLELFGLSGFVVGPVIAALFIAVWEIFIASRRPGSEPNARTG